LIYDILGREVAVLVSREMSAGSHTERWNAAGMPSGVYLCRMTAKAAEGGHAGSFSETRKLLLLQ
jgi:hypothetical protein